MAGAASHVAGSGRARFRDCCVEASVAGAGSCNQHISRHIPGHTYRVPRRHPFGCDTLGDPHHHGWQQCYASFHPRADDLPGCGTRRFVLVMGVRCGGTQVFPPITGAPRIAVSAWLGSMRGCVGPTNDFCFLSSIMGHPDVHACGNHHAENPGVDAFLIYPPSAADRCVSASGIRSFRGTRNEHRGRPSLRRFHGGLSVAGLMSATESPTPKAPKMGRRDAAGCREPSPTPTDDATDQLVAIPNHIA